MNDEQRTLQPGSYNIHSMRLHVREDGVQVLVLAVNPTGAATYKGDLHHVMTVLAGPPPTPEATVIANAKAASYHCLHTKFGADDPLVQAFILDRETRLGTEAWTPYYSEGGREEDGEGVMFIRDWLIKDFDAFVAARELAEVVAREHENGGIR